MLVLFWSSLAVIAYVYFGYPLLLWLGVLGKPGTNRGKELAACDARLISVIAAAHNEESLIEAKIRNVLDSDYPRERIEILIGSDGSSDRTEEIVRRFASQGVGLVSFPQQQGKSAMQNRLVATASGEILVLTDADCLFARDAIPLALENFADPRVGLVTARPRFFNEGDTAITANEGIYLRYETWLRLQESERSLLAMASGSFVAIRRSLWRPLEPDLGDDFVLPLRVAQIGSLNVLDERIIASTHLSEDRPSAMLRTKTRIITKDFRGLLAYAHLLNPIRHGDIAVSLLSHKLLRWFIPYLLLVLLAADLCLLHRPVFRLFLALQAAFYALALLGFALQNWRRASLLSVPLSFCVVNLAALIGTARCLLGRTSALWTPARNQSVAARFRATVSSRECK